MGEDLKNLSLLEFTPIDLKLWYNIRDMYYYIKNYEKIDFSKFQNPCNSLLDFDKN